jgi:hypothetical protein
LDKIASATDKFVDTMPVVGTIHRAADAVQKWPQSKEPLNNPPSSTTSPTSAALRQFGAGALADTAGLVKGATSPAGLATTAAAAVAPEIVGPALAGHGIYSAVKGWGDLSDPDVLQRELMSGAETAGGAALSASMIKAGGGPVTQAVRANRAAAAPAQAISDTMQAIPPTRSAPYTEADLRAARPYLEAEHAGSPITSVVAQRDAADSAIGKIEDQIEDKISGLPNVRFKPPVLQDVTPALQNSPRGQSFVDAGLKDLEDFNLDQPETLEEADAIRRQLNLENQAVLAQNNYKVAVARATDPGFAAREAAAESLRNGIYDQLQANGMPEARQLRLDEGSLIKIRNASQAQIYSGDKIAPGTRTGAVTQAVRRTARLVGAGIGAHVGGPVGAIAGGSIGDTVGTAIAPSGLTRDALIARAFKNAAVSAPAAATPTPAPAASSNLAPFSASIALNALMSGPARSEVQ